MAKEVDLERRKRELEEYFERKEQRQAPAWRPAPNTTIRGTVTALRMNENSDYGPYPVVIYDVPELGQKIALHAFHTILRERLAELQTKIGTEQFVTYLGTRASNSRTDSNGNPVQYHNYDVENVGADTDESEVDVNFHF